MNLEEFICFRDAYVALLRLPYGTFRAENQYLLISLRDTIANAFGVSGEEVQSYYEEREND